MKTARIVFLLAGAYGILALLPLYFAGGRAGLPAGGSHPEFYFGFVGVALAWQIAFLQVARDPIRLRPLMLVGVVEKAAFAIPALLLYSQSRVGAGALVAALIDLLFGGLFVLAYRSTARETAEPR